MRAAASLWPVAVGVGWREPHYREVMATGAPGVDFLEVHTENFLAPGGATRQLLRDAALKFPLSLHGVGMSLGSAAGIDLGHLKQVRALVDEVRPGLVSEHAGFSRVRRDQGPMHAHELLPVPFSERGLALLAAQVDTAQQTLGRQILIENLSAYVAWEEDTIREPEFFNRLAAATGCGLLLDLNNLHVNALNRGLDEDAAVCDCTAWLDGIDAGAVGQYHLAGHARVDGMVLDHHGGRVAEATWSIYRHALGRIGARPTLIEWDAEPPVLSTLAGEAARARREQGAFERELIAPPPARPAPRSPSRRRMSKPLTQELGHAAP
jgi:uncharacterized protein (UPF0276 family)